jgi:hypothetical protein
MARRIRTFTIDAHGLATIMTEGHAWRCKGGVPDGARILAAQFDLMTNRFRVAVEHSSFDEVPDGIMPPEFAPLLERLKACTAGIDGPPEGYSMADSESEAIPEAHG